MKVIALALLLAVALAGCGGGEKMYSKEKTEACFSKNPAVKVDHAVDFVASTASKGAFRVTFDNNVVTLVFTSGKKEASNIASAYWRFHAKNVGLRDVLEETHNVVMLWQYHPGVIRDADVAACLK